jgi:hypothetical protein
MNSFMFRLICLMYLVKNVLLIHCSKMNDYFDIFWHMKVWNDRPDGYLIPVRNWRVWARVQKSTCGYGYKNLSAAYGLPGGYLATQPKPDPLPFLWPRGLLRLFFGDKVHVTSSMFTPSLRLPLKYKLVHLILHIFSGGARKFCQWVHLRIRVN